MIVTLSVLVVVVFVVGLVLLLWGDNHYDNRFIAAGLIIILVALLCVFSNPSPCSDCGVVHRSRPCPQMVCAECGRVTPKKDKECNCKKPVAESDKCCGACGQEIVVNIEVSCEHECDKSMTGAFCPNCRYNMHITVKCPSCNKEFKPSEVPSYCPDCGQKITEAAPSASKEN